MIMATVLGISGSPVPNSNVDQTIQAILDATGAKTRFIKLSTMNIRPCIGCLGCAKDNRCKQQDDYAKEVESEVREAKALVIGGYPPFGAVDAFTKSFIERLYSLRHQKQLLKGKLGVAVAGGYKGNEKVKDFLENFFKTQQLQHAGTIVTCGNATCLSCGFGDDCVLSNVPMVFGEGAKCSLDKYVNFSERPDLREEARIIGVRLKSLL